MLSHLRTVDRHLLIRRCVKCGYDGASINRPGMTRCMRCGCDLRERPPRSYAEMEGLLGSPESEIEAIEVEHERRQGERLVHRWLAVLFFALLGLLAIAMLSAEAMGM